MRIAKTVYETSLIHNIHLPYYAALENVEDAHGYSCHPVYENLIHNKQLPY